MSFLRPEERNEKAKEWQEAARKHYSSYSPKRVFEYRVAESMGDKVDDRHHDIETIHGVNFLEDVIPEVIEKCKKMHTKPKILLLGSGAGIFNDQIRFRFGEQVHLSGINITHAYAAKRKKELIDHVQSKVKNSALRILDDSPKRSATIREQVNRSWNKSDSRWRSILELTDFPEFDLIIDTHDELYYSSPNFEKKDEGSMRDFDHKLTACIRKLRVDGELYIGVLPPEGFAFLWKEARGFESTEGVDIFFAGKKKEEWVDLFLRLFPDSFLTLSTMLQHASVGVRWDSINAEDKDALKAFLKGNIKIVKVVI